MKAEDRKNVIRERYSAKMKLLALKLYEEEVAENTQIMETAGKNLVPDYAKRAFGSAYDRVKREKRKAMLLRISRRAASCAAVLTLVIFVTSALFGIRVDAMIHKIFAVLFTETATYDEITTAAGDSETIVDKDEQNSRFLGYIPDGYELSIQEIHTGLTLTVFTNGRQNQIRIEETSSGNGNMMLDNEGTGHGKTIVNGETAFWSENEGGIYLYWPHEDSSVTVFSDVETLDILIKIAESIKPHM
jgi:hypothetical protein